MTTIVISPASGGAVTVGRNRYQSGAGQVLSVPDGDVPALGAAGWLVVGTTGTTAGRPAATAGTVPTAAAHIDTTLGKTVVSDGATWRDPTTGKQV